MNSFGGFSPKGHPLRILHRPKWIWWCHTSTRIHVKSWTTGRHTSCSASFTAKILWKLSTFRASKPMRSLLNLNCWQDKAVTSFAVSVHENSDYREMEVSIANVQTKPRSLFAIPRFNGVANIVPQENGGIKRFVRVSSGCVILISGMTYFCFQGAILELTIAKNQERELTFTNRHLIFLFTL